MPLHPMEWILSAYPLSRRVLLLLCGALLISAPVHSAVLRLNPDDNPNNVITFDGALNATVVQSAAGMDIIIPGVKFTLECEGDPADSCTISAASSTPSSPTTSAPPSTTTAPPPTTSAPSNDDDCEGATGFGTIYGCGDGDDDQAPPAAQTPPEDDPNSGFDVPTSSTPTDDGNSSSSGWTLAPPPAGSTGDGPTRGDFPASNRVGYSSSPDVGSGGAQRGGNTHRTTLGLKTVRVLPFTMASSAASGGVGFYQPSNAPSGSDLALWISKSQDGDAVSGCRYYGGFDGKMRISTTGGQYACTLERGGSYFLNVAACVRGSNNDYYCRNAQTGYESGDVFLTGEW